MLLVIDIERNNSFWYLIGFDIHTPNLNPKQFPKPAPQKNGSIS
jgi:hypothetical protein